jgi:hypothetical protein
MPSPLNAEAPVVLTYAQLRGRVLSCIRCGHGRFAKIFTEIAEPLMHYASAQESRVGISPQDVLYALIDDLEKAGLLEYNPKHSKWMAR